MEEKLYTQEEFTRMAKVFYRTAKKRYEKGVEDGKELYKDLINQFKKDIDKGLAREIMLQNEITKLKKQIKRG